MADVSMMLLLEKDTQHSRLRLSNIAFQDQKALFECNDSEGHSGQFVYIRDDREDKEYFGMCEVEVFEHKG